MSGKRINKKVSIPDVVKEWVKSHKGSRSAKHSPGMVDKYLTATTSDCWVNRPGGAKVGDYRVGVCQPSPVRNGEPAFFLYDFKEAT